MTTAILQELPRGAVFVKPTGYSARNRYEVTTPACEHPEGWVLVRNLSMSDSEAERRIAADRLGPDEDPRDGFFAYPNPVEVEVLSC